MPIFPDGQVQPVGTPFHTIWGNDLLYPGDPSAPAREVINCHCVLVPEVDVTARSTAMAQSSLSVGELRPNMGAKEIAKEWILSGSYPLTINPEKQARHMVGTPSFIEGRSAITIPMDRLQQLIDQFAGHGDILINGLQVKEIVDVHEVIGYTVNQQGDTVNTQWMKIHYSKTGVHAVPFSGGGSS